MTSTDKGKKYHRAQSAVNDGWLLVFVSKVLLGHSNACVVMAVLMLQGQN